MKAIKALVMSLALAGLWACDDSGCQLNNVVMSYYSFYGHDAGRLVPVALNDTLTVRAAGTDSVLVYMQPKASKLQLPMSYFASADTIVFEYINNTLLGRDTIFVQKENCPHFESPECPTAMFHSISCVRSTHLAIDTVLIIKSAVNYELDENIRVVFGGSD